MCKVGNEVLYEEDLSLIQNVFYANLDPTQAREMAIQHWIQQKQIALEIQDTQAGTKEINEVIAAQDLARLNLFELENKYIKAHLDSLIHEDEIQAFYMKHRDDYRTQTYIVRALYIQIPDSVARELKVEDYYLLKNDKDIEEIKKIGNLYATNFYYEEDSWIFFDDLIRGIQISDEDREKLIKDKKSIIIYGEETYFINILDYKVKSVSSPLESEKEKIRNDILKQKISQLRNDAKDIILKQIDEKFPVTYF
ncbi:MAG: hypothetical protein WC994_09990 [Brumimicrobium sp.]